MPSTMWQIQYHRNISIEIKIDARNEKEKQLLFSVGVAIEIDKSSEN